MSFTIDWSDNKFKLRHEVQQPNQVIATLLRLVLSFYADEKVIMQTYDSEIAYQGNSK